MPIAWKVDQYLEKENVTAYRFMVETQLSPKVAYSIAKGEHRAVDAGVLDKVIPYLRELTGDESLQLGDIVEYQP